MATRIVGSSPATKKTEELLKSVAQTDATVLIRGESGCGKELYARALHEYSKRAAEPFIPINCGAIPAELLESQLFGHKKGAFTGAIADFKGKFLEAQNGTIFLDEIGDMPFEMQVKLLRVLQERNLTPIGSNQLIDVDVRVVAATHRDVEQEIQANRFRQDLFYRLNVVPVVLLPLRERSGEITELVTHFAGLYAQEGYQPIQIAPAFMKILEAHSWPGNVRELSNTIQRFSILYPGKKLEIHDVDESMMPTGILEKVELIDDIKILDAEGDEPYAESGPHSSDHPGHPEDQAPGSIEDEVESIVRLAQGYSVFDDDSPSLRSVLGDIERDLIKKALDDCGGNVSKSAKLLKIQRTTLIERIKKFEI